MKHTYLEITFRRGKPLAAYLYLPRRRNVKSVRTEAVGPGLRADFDAEGTVMGVEVTAPGAVTIEELNQALAKLGAEPLRAEDWAPLSAA